MSDKPTTITATELQQQSGSIIRRAFGGEHIVVERSGYPMVVVISVDDYEQLTQSVDKDEA